MIEVLARLDAALTAPPLLSWVKQHLITYADDLLAMWCVNHRSQVIQSIKQIGIVLDILDDLGMTVNLTKSVVLLRLSGRQSQSLKKKLLVKTKTGCCIRVPRANGHTLIPVVMQHTYLGIKIGYHQFEDQTLKYRLQIGRTAFVRLRPWLTQRHSFPLALRIKLWVTCVRTACSHGLQATGLTPSGALKLHRHFVGDLRRIAKSPNHITHETTTDLCARLRVLLPLHHLQDFWQQQHDRALRTWQGLPSTDFLCTFDLLAHHAHTMQVFYTNNPMDMTDIQLCPYCDYTTIYQSQLTRHLRSVHHVTKITPTYTPLRDALAGHPQCAHCLRRLATRAGLIRHIIANNCYLYDEARPLQAALADDPRLRRMAASGDWTPLWTNAQLLQRIREQCTLCGLQYSTRKSMVEHLQKDHRQAWEFAQPFVTQTAGSTSSNPCNACGHTGKKTHQCPVVRQLACIVAMQHSNLQVCDLPSLPPQQAVPLTSPLKRTRLSEAIPIEQTSIQFQPARDAQAGGPTCAHCGAASKTMYILRRHIEDGTCRMFQANRPIGPHVPSSWPDLIQRATLNPKQLLHAEDVTKLLCGSCVLCGQLLQRSGAILPHLQKDHPVMFNAAQEDQVELLRQLAKEAPCCCGRRRPDADHRCPVHYQIALLHHLGGLRSPIQTVLPTQADFETLWADPNVRAKLTHTCAACNAPCGIHDLSSHLEVHAALTADLMPLLPLAQCPYMDCCEACLAAPALLPFCPVALNLCIYACHGRERRDLPHDSGGHDGRDGRELGKSPPGQRSQQENQESSRPSASSTDDTSAATALSSVKGTDPTHSQARESAASTGHGRPIHPLFASRRSTPPAVQSELTMAGQPTQGTEHHGSSNQSVPSADPGALDAAGEGDGCQTPRRTMGGSTESPPLDGEGCLAFHAVQSTEESPDAYARQDPYLHGRDEAMGGGTPRTGSITKSDPSIQSPQTADDLTKRRLHFSLATSGEWQNQSPLGTSIDNESLGSLAAALLPIEAPPIEVKPFGRTIGKTVGRPIQGDRMMV